MSVLITYGLQCFLKASPFSGLGCQSQPSGEVFGLLPEFQFDPRPTMKLYCWAVGAKPSSRLLHRFIKSNS